MAEINMVQSLNRTLDMKMGEDSNIILLGEDIGKDGGVFRVTEGLQAKYGEDRVIDTPLVELGIVGMAWAGVRLVRHRSRAARPVFAISSSRF